MAGPPEAGSETGGLSSAALKPCSQSGQLNWPPEGMAWHAIKSLQSKPQEQMVFMAVTLR